MFTITSLSEVGAKSIRKIYEKMGYKHVSLKYDKKKEVHINTFNDTAKTYVSDRVFDGVRPITGKRLEALKKKRKK